MGADDRHQQDHGLDQVMIGRIHLHQSLIKPILEEQRNSGLGLKFADVGDGKETRMDERRILRIKHIDNINEDRMTDQFLIDSLEVGQHCDSIHFDLWVGGFELIGDGVDIGVLEISLGG